MGDQFRCGGRGERRDNDSAEDGSYLTTGSTSDRGQAHVLGLILLIGAVTTASVGILVFGSTGLHTQQTTIETEYAEQSMLEFAHSTTTVTTDRSPSDVSLGPFDRGRIEMRNDTGRVNVTYIDDSGETEVLYDEPFGSVIYSNDDTEIAYQGGGVWRTDGTGSTMVSAPGIEYREGTLTFPIVHLDGDRVGGDTVDGTVRQGGTPKRIDLGERRNRDRESVAVRIGIESEYCDAWERELEESVTGSVTERCKEGKPRRVRIRLIDPTGNNRALDSAVIGETVTAGFDESTGARPIDGDANAGTIDEWMVNGTVSDENYDYPSADESIDDALEACDGFETLDEDITEPGVYCVDEIDGGHDFDTSNGDIDVVVRDSFDLSSGNGDIDVEGDNDLTIYADTDLEVKGNTEIGNESDPSQTRLVFSSESTVQTVRGTPEIRALVYAPDSTVEISGTPTIVGSIVGDEIEIDDVAVEIRHDGSLTNLDLIPGAGPHVPYASIAVSDVEFDD
ncbi:DUF7289 family protein [Natrinema salinisoli]|uniref:DUF7289 family protein n=1 Tax=Natrinema salinisoli TaxID=2878535 RepID=UPI001CF03152|nr:hypothetical protein [Natrinema salinisoli]